MSLKIIALMKQVPLPTEMRMGADGLMDRTTAKSRINIDCAFGLEEGLQIKSRVKDAELFVISMGPPSFEQSLRKALAMGYDRAILLSDRKLGGSDTYSTGLAIAMLLKKLGFSAESKEPFIVFSGRQTSDGDTAHVPSQVAENLKIPQATFIEKVDWKGDSLVVRRIIEGGHQSLKLPIPCLISVAPTAIPPRRPTLKGAIKAKDAKIEIWSLDQVGLGPEHVGLTGSPTIVAKVVNIERDRPPIRMIPGTTPEALASNLISETGDISSGETFHKKDSADSKKDSASAGSAPKPEFPRIDFRQGARGILAWIEMHGKIPARSSLEILNPARKLADQLSTKVTALMIGDDIGSAAPEIIAHGADEVVIVNDRRLAEYAILPFTSVFAQVIENERPEIALFGATTSGRELAPRIASRVKAGVTADCTSLEVGEFVHRAKKSIMYPCLESIRPTYGESKLATIVGFWCPQMATARPGTFEKLVPDPARKGKIIEIVPKLNEGDFKTEILETVRVETGGQNLFAADIIVSGGRPCGELDEFKLIKELVEALREKGINADWGASRRAVDGDFAPYARQIGQTGKTVRPKIYIAVAISGAIQHIAGIKESGKIIAINKDPQANIFRHADYGIARDYLEFLPELIKKVKAGFIFGLTAGKK
ncbi:MAG TPA: FAD-binding protein [Candidatus Omnitrophota bacterium]|nr:FAD-binding protein [Candidatus Omnitrophota bacterium]